jgi:hypothetical protein
MKWTGFRAGLLHTPVCHSQPCLSWPMQVAACQAAAEEYGALSKACAPADAPPSPQNRQHLFSLYVHAPPSLAGESQPAVLLSLPVRTAWGQHAKHC